MPKGRTQVHHHYMWILLGVWKNAGFPTIHKELDAIVTPRRKDIMLRIVHDMLEKEPALTLRTFHFPTKRNKRPPRIDGSGNSY